MGIKFFYKIWGVFFRGSCVLGGPFEGYMGMKPIEPGIRALSIND